MKTFGIALCVILFAFVYFVQAENDGYTYVVQRLNKFQTSSGGFKLRESDTSESLEATADAIFLASLFGLKEEINVENVAKYLNSLRNPDFGFGKNPGNASNLEATSQVISCSKHIKGTISLDNVAAFVKSKLQGHSGLFGSLKSTVFAVQIMHSLNSSESWYKKDVRSDVLKYLSSHRVISKSSGDSSFSFHAETSLSAIEANYYGILLGRLVGFDFGDLAPWGKFIHKFQNADGGFKANPSDKASSIDATSNALASLRLLQSPDVDHSSSLNFINSHISVDTLSSYLTSSTPRDLSAVAGAHLAIALTNKFVSNFQTTVSYVATSSGSEVSQRIIQGSKIRPVLSILSLGRIPHRGLSVQASTLLNNHKPPSKLQLASPILDVKESQYSTGSDYLDTSDILGVLKFVFNVTLELPQPLGSVSFQIVDEKKIGFGLIIDSTATLPDVAKREFRVGDVVALETQFDFKLNLANKSDSNEKASDKILNGNFFVVFSLLDSSGVIIHREAKDCKKNSAPLEFQYKLTSSNIPAGELTFRFDVADNSDVGTVPHTTENQAYQVAFPMVASEIRFYGKEKEEKREFKIGETVNVRIQPASFQDLQTPNPYSAKNVLGENIGNKRNFVMDVKSPGGVLLRTVNGVAENNNRYVFPLKIEPTLDLIGTNVVSFKYKASNGEIVELGNFDVESGNLVEDTSLLNFTVKAKLQMVSSSGGIVNNSHAYYGNLVELRFKLLDSKSGVHIKNDESDDSHANVYLELKHKSDNRPVPFVSDVEAAQADTEENDPQLFVIKWKISPNAVRGPGELTVSVKGADGNIIPIYDGNSGKDVRYRVDIGGDIESDAKVYSVARINKDKTAFVVTFKLECNDKILTDAQLRCSVVDSSKHHKLVTSSNNKNKKVKAEEKEEGVLIRGVPVANSGDVYSVSWALPHEEVHSGNYYLRCYRETDRKRTVEDREFVLKKKRHDALSKRELEGTDDKVDEDDEVDAADIEDEMEPLFIIEIEHVGVISRFFVRPEILLALLAGAAFLALSYRKKQYVTN